MHQLSKRCKRDSLIRCELKENEAGNNKQVPDVMAAIILFRRRQLRPTESRKLIEQLEFLLVDMAKEVNKGSHSKSSASAMNVFVTLFSKSGSGDIKV